MWLDIFQNLLMWAVPMFLMVTGALLLDPKKELGRKRLIKYISRVAIALVAFTFIYQLLDTIYESTEFDFIVMIKTWVSKLLTGQSWAPTWYLYLMIGLYLMIPFYKMITKNATLNQIGFLILIFIVFISIIPLIKIGGKGLGFYIPTAIIYPCYLFLGYFIHSKEVPKWIYIVLFVFSTIAIVLISFTQFMNLGKFDEDISMGYENVLVVLQAAGLFGLLKNIKLNPGSFIKSIDKATFGIYLFHIILVKMIFHWLGFNPYEFSKQWWGFVVIGVDLGIFILSCGVTLFFKTIFNKNMLPNGGKND